MLSIAPEYRDLLAALSRVKRTTFERAINGRFSYSNQENPLSVSYMAPNKHVTHEIHVLAKLKTYFEFVTKKGET